MGHGVVARRAPGAPLRPEPPAPGRTLPWGTTRSAASWTARDLNREHLRVYGFDSIRVLSQRGEMPPHTGSFPGNSSKTKTQLEHLNPELKQRTPAQSFYTRESGAYLDSIRFRQITLRVYGFDSIRVLSQRGEIPPNTGSFPGNSTRWISSCELLV